ncbi:MAG: type II secretion system ATPase GspE [Candidatus Binatia bacterium]
MNALETLLVRETGIDAEVLERARDRRRDGRELGDVLLEMGAISPERWAEVQAMHYGLSYVREIPPDSVPVELLRQLPINFAKRYNLLPIGEQNGRVLIAVADPSDPGPLDDLRLLFNKPVRPVVAPAPLVADAINRAYDAVSGSTEQLVEGLDEERLDLIATEVEETKDLLDGSDEGPIIKLVNSLIFQAARDRASDIHIEPFERDLVVRMRIDGILYDVVKPPKRFQPIIISRVKIMAGLNIAEKRLPQDGRIRTRIAGKDVDVRVSVIPTSFGERVVLRLLDRSSTLLPLEDLGLDGQNLVTVERLIRQSHGIVLVTGPTGSGKTTTLYACLQKINVNDKNILTIEDPVEYQLHGVAQMQVNPKIDLTFANGLRSFLRQDPDVILVGEIRDSETAEISIHAALTGHLVFSTLHTNDSFGAVTRLVDMGIEPFLVSSSVIAVMAQRLIRRVCSSCREGYTPTDAELREIGLTRTALGSRMIYRPGNGCVACKQRGYRGRIGIHELLVVDDAIRQLIMQKADASMVRKAATSRGMPTLREDGARKVLEGITSVEEILRVTQDDVIVEEAAVS